MDAPNTDVAKQLLQNYAFMYEDSDNISQDTAYLSVFVLQMITSTHLSAIIDHADVPTLHTDELALGKGMDGVIVPCVVTVIKVKDVLTSMTTSKSGVKLLKMLNKMTGKMSSGNYKFSFVNWHEETESYMKSIGSRNEETKLNIILSAQKLMKKTLKADLSDDDMEERYYIVTVSFKYQKEMLEILDDDKPLPFLVDLGSSMHNLLHKNCALDSVYKGLLLNTEPDECKTLVVRWMCESMRRKAKCESALRRTLCGRIPDEEMDKETDVQMHPSGDYYFKVKPNSEGSTAKGSNNDGVGYEVPMRQMDIDGHSWMIGNAGHLSARKRTRCVHGNAAHCVGKYRAYGTFSGKAARDMRND
ncbi:hypothetical protein F4604DRAFT_1684917 [Suillus subluteus]|nr:hypothetical protein F4604DRAFT_1684917 [Suillus subluteus]